MSKDIEWLKGRILATQETYVAERDSYEPHSGGRRYCNGALSSISLILDLINQLDGSEVLSEGWLDENKSSWTKLKIDGFYIPVEKLQNLLVPKQGLDVLSQEWIERNTSPVDDEGRLYIWKRDLENLLVPKQEPSETSAPLIVSEELGAWLGYLNIGNSSRYFTMIDSLFHYWDSTVGSPTGDFISENKKELIEVVLGTRGYEVEEAPKYHALIKGYELLDIDGVYWTRNKNNGDVLFSKLHSPDDNFSIEMSKAEWDVLGINDSNAHFVKVDN